MYKFSTTSLRRLNTCHDDLRAIAKAAIATSPIDFGIACGQRTVEEQKELYAEGRTKPGRIVTYVDGTNKRSKHNYTPSLAFDVYAWVDGAASWKRSTLMRVAAHIIEVADDMFERGEVSHQIRWGGDWDRDGDTTDHRFVDMPHFELIT